MNPAPFDLLIEAFTVDRACYVLGAGASAPHVPTMGQLPERIASYAPRLGSFAPSLPDSPLRRLLGPILEEALTTSSLDRWKAGAMTPATIAVILQDLIAAAHWIPIPQYSVFGLIPVTATIVSFNWDGLATARCRQEVLCPHGVVRPRFFTPVELDNLLDNFQFLDTDEPRGWIIPALVMPGEEEGKELAEMREKVLKIWLAAPQVTVIGYSFGIHSSLNYDRVWLETFVEAFRTNKKAPIHIVSPDATGLRDELAAGIKRTVNIHAWPLNWHILSLALLKTAERRRYSTVAELRPHAEVVRTLYDQLARRASALT